jgi:serine/threonine-protein kinase HipA
VAYQSVDLLEVWAWGQRVGAVARNPEGALSVFQYTPEWIEGGIALSPLTMPLRQTPYDVSQWDIDPEPFKYLPPPLADSLPDAFGNALVDEWMSRQGIDQQRITPLDRLAYAADRAIGALEFRPPARVTRTETTAVQLADLVTAARRTVRGVLADDASAHAALDMLIQVGSSAGGARAKAVVAFNPRTYQIHSAFSGLEEGYEHWLIKLDGVSATGMDGHGDALGESAPYGRVEYAYYLMAQSAGITMGECRLLHEGPRRHFMTKRFDRGPRGERHHVMTLCAMANLDHRLVGRHGYDQYLGVVSQLGLGLNARVEAFRRMAFNVAAVNFDDHTKNLSFLHRRVGAWELAPAYDVTHAYNSASPWTQRQALSVNGKVENISLDDLYAVGERHDVPSYKALVREVDRAVDQWKAFSEIAEVDDETAHRIELDIEHFRPR